MTLAGVWSGIEVPGVGPIAIAPDEATARNAEEGIPRGEVWTVPELAMLRSVGPTVDEARAVADCKRLFNGRVVRAGLGDRGPAVEVEPIPVPHRGHGPKPGPQNFRLP